MNNLDPPNFPVSPDNFSRLLHEGLELVFHPGRIDEIREAAATVFAQQSEFPGGWDELLNGLATALWANENVTELHHV